MDRAWALTERTRAAIQAGSKRKRVRTAYLADERDEGIDHERTHRRSRRRHGRRLARPTKARIDQRFHFDEDQVTPVRYSHLRNRASDTASGVSKTRRTSLGERGRGREQALTVLDRGRIGIAALRGGIVEAALKRANSYPTSGNNSAMRSAISGGAMDAGRSAMEQKAAEVMTMHAAYLQNEVKIRPRNGAMAKLMVSEWRCGSVIVDPNSRWLRFSRRPAD